MEELSIEIENDLLIQLEEVLEPMGITTEQLLMQFIRFCSDPNNYDEVKSFFENCKNDAIA